MEGPVCESNYVHETKRTLLFSNIMTQPTLLLLQMSFSLHHSTLYFLLRIGSLDRYGRGCQSASGIFVITPDDRVQKVHPLLHRWMLPNATGLLAHPRTATMSRQIGVNVNVGGSANASGIGIHLRSPRESGIEHTTLDTHQMRRP